MATFDYVLGVAELGLVIASVSWLVVAMRRRTRLRGPVALCLFTALTVAQPFGVVASPDDAPRRGGAVSAEDVHLIGGPAGLRIPFAVYHREDALGGLAENTTHASLRV